MAGSSTNSQDQDCAAEEDCGVAGQRRGGSRTSPNFNLRVTCLHFWPPASRHSPTPSPGRSRSDRLHTPPASCHSDGSKGAPRAINIRCIWIVRRKNVIVRHASNPKFLKCTPLAVCSNAFPVHPSLQVWYSSYMYSPTHPCAILRRLDHLRRRERELRVEHTVPELARDAEPVLVVGEVVLQVILLELAVVRRKTAAPLANGISAFMGHTHLR